MIKARRIRHVSFSTPDIARQADYYQSIVGLGVVAREFGSRCSWRRNPNELAIVLEAGDEPACKRIAFEVAPDVDLAELRADLSASGITSDIRSDSAPGISRSLVFTDPEGTEIELISGWTPSPAKEPVGGIAANRLGHVAMYTADPLLTSKFYSDVLGFRVSDWIEDILCLHAMRLRSSLAQFRRRRGAAHEPCRVRIARRLAHASRLRPARAQPDARSCGDRSGTDPATTSRSIIAIPTGRWSSCSSISTA